MSKKKSFEKGNNTELRIILIGESGVGKKSIVQRFKLLSCTKTIDLNKERSSSSNDKSKKQKENQNKSKEKNIKAQLTNQKSKNGKDTNTKTFTNSNSYTTNTLKEGTDKEELEEIENQRKAKKREEKRISLMHFSKYYKVDCDSLELFFFPCAEAQPLPYDYEFKEDEFYEFEKEYKSSIRTMIKELEQIILKQPENQNSQVEIAFFLCFDLSNMASFEKLVIYFSIIQKHFNLHFDQGFHLILIGNKVDKKKEMKKEEKNYLNQFISRMNIPYYEISTLMFFNFEFFFEKILLENFSYISFISDDAGRKKFLDILTKKNNFSKSERIIFDENTNPGPNKYKSDIYSYPTSRRELVKLYSNKRKYNKKIFINKCGILFPPIPKNKDKDNLPLSNTKETFSADSKKEAAFQSYADYENRQKLKESMQLQTKKPGCSLGGRTFQSLNLLQKRKDLRDSRDLLVKNTLAEAGLVLRNSQKIKNNDHSQEKYEKNRIEKQQMFLEKLQKSQDNLKKRHDETNLKNSKDIKQKNEAVLEKEEKYQKLYDAKKKQMQISEYKNILKNIRESYQQKKSKFPPPKFYDPLSSISLTRGFSFGLKLDNKIKNTDAPDFVNFDDDFDKIIKKNKNKQCLKSKSQRFPKFKTIEIGDSSSLMQKQVIFEKNRKVIKQDELNDFLQNRKIRKEDVEKNKKRLQKEKENKVKEQISKQYNTDNNYLFREINYNQVENSSPKYTMRNKYEFGSIFQRDKTNDEQNDLSNYGMTIFNQENKNKNKNKLHLSELENPNIAVVRPKYPVFSFGNEKRFEDFNKKKEKSNKFRYSNSETYFGYSDTKSFLKLQTSMGTGKKLEVKDNGYPGPGFYTIKGFAENVASKGLEVDLARSKVREKEKLEKIEKEKREKLREQRYEEKKYALKMGLKDTFKEEIKDDGQEVHEFHDYEKDNCDDIKDMWVSNNNDNN